MGARKLVDLFLIGAMGCRFFFPIVIVWPFIIIFENNKDGSLARFNEYL